MTISNKKWWVLLSTGIMIMLVNIDMTIVNLALAKISAFFDSTINQAQWIIGSYLFSTALSFLIFGSLADHWGRKKIFMSGIVLFTIASLIAGVTNNLNLLIIARFIQGLGFAATLGLSIVFILDAFPENQKGFATGMAVLITGLSQVIGPTLGGAILAHLNWHWIFLINVPLGAISLFMAYWIIPHDMKKITNSFPFCLTNAILFISGLGVILYALNQTSVSGGYLTAFLVILGSGLLAGFIKHCKTSARTLIDIELLYNRPFRYAILLRFIFMIMMSSVLFIIPLYLQNILNYSPFEAGLSLLAMTVFVAMASPITGRIIDKIGYCLPMVASFIFSILSALLMQYLHVTASFFTLIPCLVLFGLAVGSHTPSSISATLAQVPKEKSGTAIGLFFTMAISGAVIGVALSGTMMDLLSRHFLLAKLPLDLSAELNEKLLRAASGAVDLNNIGLTVSEFSTYHSHVHLSYMTAFHINVAILSILMLIGLLIAFKFKQIVQLAHN